MSDEKKIPKTYLRFREKYPDVAASYESLGKSTAQIGALDRRTVAMVKLALAPRKPTSTNRTRIRGQVHVVGDWKHNAAGIRTIPTHADTGSESPNAVGKHAITLSETMNWS